MSVLRHRSCPIRPIGSECIGDRGQSRWKLALRRHAEIHRRPSGTDVQILVEQLGALPGEAVDTDEEHALELEALDVLDAEHPHIAIVPG